MVKFFEGEFRFNYSWNQVAQGLWNRYPNPQSKHVLTEDVISRFIGQNNLLHSKRLLTKTNRLPKWGEKFVKCRAVAVLEESVVDPINKTVVTYTRNIGLANVMTVIERCVYRQDSNNPSSSTVLERQAWISSSIYGFSRAIQAFGIERYKQNSIKAAKGLNYVLDTIFKPTIQDSTTPALPLINREKLKETAKKAKEFAKSSPSGGFVTA